MKVAPLVKDAVGDGVTFAIFFYPFQFSKRWKLFDIAGERERTLKCECRLLLSGFV